MATNQDYIEYVVENLKEIGNIHYKKMFGEYMIYMNEKPVLIVCDSTVYVKKLDSTNELLKDASVGYPYKGAKEHYILDIDNFELSKKVILEVEKVTSIPKKKKIK